ncbi:sensor histidine kinase [Actinomyces bowdenii]|uniref:histidine kinase n=1 Tax=Actinomyces bowdenii TaxID=131109 RepID=A0A853EJG0_9ACTO|nr:sensor domain-containing protein [Actinomyces bowdenii]MBF0697255.1 sensor domain-containing protein [Actinomyces bowdenii]NYS69428.1 sensor domain-containing protein [Actinomyces bowdenii]
MNLLRSWSRRLPQARRDAAYLLLAWPVHLMAFCLVIPLAATGIGTIVIWVGLPILVMTLLITGGFADMARRAASAVDGSAPVPAHYLPVPQGASTIRGLLHPLKDPQRWMDLLWIVVSFPVSLALWSLTVIWLSVAVGGLLAPIVEVVPELIVPESNQGWAELLGLPYPLLWNIVVDLIIAVLFLAAAPAVLRGLAAVHSGLTRLMLSWRGEVGRLETSRAAVQRAESDTRRRLERDIHDGPQQRLVRLTMDLARAKRQAGKDPQATTQILQEAMGQAQATLDELRHLSRGIAPPILVDRGLGAAISEAATLSSVPVTVSADLPDLSDLPDHAAQAAYFVISEALANVNKHSGATRAHVGAAVRDGLLHAWVEDNGMGGASPAKGHGLSGLAERLAGVDGRLTLTSPQGGPTRVEAVIPCAS